MGLAANPRQVKRFINSFLLLLSIASMRAMRINHRLIAGLVGLQLRWPAEYQDLAEAVYSEDSDPLAGLTSADQPDLARYSKAFFSPTPKADELRAVMHLAESVTQPEPYSGYQSGEYQTTTASAQELREVASSEILTALGRKGFKESARAAHIFYHRELPNHRVRIGKTVVRFEAKDPLGRWLLGLSLYLTKALPEAVEMIDDFSLLRARTNSAIEASHGPASLPRPDIFEH
ncbi:hypothetical protein EV643_114259 [Kribbella sp. VKM Ac-2527]|uniref:Uncharacterized protein n=1 Tax=Kribbella caucasensis TaxID=2512215 RepID=A0A4V3C9D0_9ACTN|nr:hypothetical protein [Kribbella sp. VKM Ac-2527]TDO45114.1 hypothetical protein EV643_114259 [Kribbella sp. VKM Ac-2527]